MVMLKAVIDLNVTPVHRLARVALTRSAGWRPAAPSQVALVQRIIGLIVPAA